MGPRVCPGGCRPPTACTTLSSAARWCWTMAGIPERFLVASSAPRGRFEGGSYAFWSRDVPNGLRHSSWRALPCPRGTRLRVPLGAGAHEHSGEPSKPVAKPHPPILMGGDGPTTFDRVVEFADGWMPLARSGRNPAEKIGLLRQRAEKAGRDPKSISVTIFFAKPEKVALEGLRAAGVERAIFGVPSEGRDSVLPLLDSYTRVMV